jgi:hypothetical protein
MYYENLANVSSPQVSEKFVSDCFYLHAAQGMVNQPSEVRIRVESLENLKFTEEIHL